MTTRPLQLHLLILAPSVSTNQPFIQQCKNQIGQRSLLRFSASSPPVAAPCAAAPQTSKHQRSMDHKKSGTNEAEEEEEEDFFNVAIHRSGCSKEHYTLQDCYAEKGDWRKCTSEMTRFRECMDRQRTAESNTQNRNS